MLLDDDGDLPPKITKKILIKIKKWYEKVLKYNTYYEIIKINIYDKYLYVEYKINDEEGFVEEFISDPDDDGNYPLKINNIEYLVLSKIVE